ncbi:helix-turn-helix domain-containing protein [Cohnella hongkongensis]|uniref:Helix-turn-helix domain-containing protein n=1 Tax=Cohnella hongkongensis TaxID=178337 RepID=A0ABV9FHI3_9BACL
MRPLSLPDRLESGSPADSFYVEYVRRTRPFTMDVHHFHPFYELYCLLSGTRDYFVRESTYAVEAGDLVFIAPHVLHRTLLAGDPGHERIVVHFDDRFVRNAFGEHAELLLGPFGSEAPIVRLRGEGRLRLDALTGRLLEELHDRQPGRELALRTAIAELLLLSARAVGDAQAPEPSLASPTHRKMFEIARYLNANYREPIKIGELAERFYVSPYHMSRSFKAATGFTIIDYLNLTRVKEAQRLLRESRLPITEIAARTGFDNFSHFGKTFKKITRASARDYRKAHGAASPQ